MTAAKISSPAAAVPARREDVFVSVGFTDFDPSPANRDLLSELARRISDRFRYCEILLDWGAAHEEEAPPLPSGIANLRVLTMRPNTPYYRARVALAEETIGDVILLGRIEECAALDIVAMVEAAADSGDIVVGRSPRAAGGLNPLLHTAGRVAGFRVDARDMSTAAYPRVQLNRLLAHSDTVLALRFVPADQTFPVRWQAGADTNRRLRSLSELSRRLELMQRLLVGSAPRVLRAVTLSSSLVTIGSLTYALYVLLVAIFKTDIQPGWVTTSAMLSFTGTFLGAAIFGISIGFQRMLELLDDGHPDDISGEYTETDHFSQVMTELNVDLEVQGQRPGPVSRSERT